MISELDMMVWMTEEWTSISSEKISYQIQENLLLAIFTLPIKSDLNITIHPTEARSTTPLDCFNGRANITSSVNSTLSHLSGG